MCSSDLGLGDAGNEPLDQLDRTFHGAAGVGADILVGREGDHEVEDAVRGLRGAMATEGAAVSHSFWFSGCSMQGGYPKHFKLSGRPFLAYDSPECERAML